MSKFCSALLAAAFVGANASAQYLPSWWVDPVNPVIDLNKDSANYAPVTTGQLKWMALRAKLHLDATIPGGAGSGINIIVNNFEPIEPLSGYSQAELDQIYKENKAPANIAQLKHVADAFYARLYGIGYDTNANLIANGYLPSWSDSRPWNSQNPVPKSENYGPANLGQLKLVFSFDIVDSNHNGTMDYLEDIYPAALASADDLDADGVPNALDAFPRDPNRSANLVVTPGDTTGPVIIITKPAGTTLY